MKTLFDHDLTQEEAEELIKNGAVPMNHFVYDRYRCFFSDNQRKMFDLFKVFTSNANDFNQMCIAYQNDEKDLYLHKKDDYGRTLIFFCWDDELMQFLIDLGSNVNEKSNGGRSVLDGFQGLEITAKVLINNGAVPTEVETYRILRNLFSKEKQNAFDAFMSITNNNNDFYQMCLAYQNDIKNHVKIDIKEIDII